MTGLAALAAVLVQVAHHGVWEEDAIRWRTDWRSDQVETQIVLSTPLPDDTKWTNKAHATPVRDTAGQIVAFDLDPPNVGGHIEVSLPHSIPSQVLAIPILESDGVQRLTLDGVHFRPDSALGFEKHIRYWSGPNIKPQQDFERPWRSRGGSRAHTSDQAMYFRNVPDFDDGVPGQLTLEGSTTPWTQGLLLLTLGAVLLGSGLLYRSLGAQARKEKNASYIRTNFE